MNPHITNGEQALGRVTSLSAPTGSQGQASDEASFGGDLGVRGAPESVGAMLGMKLMVPLEQEL
jgi:hypothetical protein